MSARPSPLADSISVPEAWRKWHNSVRSLISEIMVLLSRSKPKPGRERQPVKLVNRKTLKSALTKVEVDACAVGNDRCRNSVSPSLYDVHRAAVIFAGRLTDHLADWLGMWLEADKIERRLRDARVDDEMEKAVLLSQPYPPDDLVVRTPLQREILKALDGRSLRQTALERATRTDRRQLHRDGGLKELRDRGEVCHHGRLGYYRPDRPPPGITEQCVTVVSP